MRNPVSFFACIVICLVLVQYRIANSDITHGRPPLKITEWDAFGYYMYLPATIIYHDCKKLDWLDAIDTKYKVTGGNGWQAVKADNGNYVFKYLGGVAVMQLPFFLTAHALAQSLGYPPDGFSPPYQYALGFGIIFYCFLALLLLRKILLRFFNDVTVALTLIMVCLATNFIQYAAVDSGQSHGYLFVLYVLVLYTTLMWHSSAKMSWAALTGLVIGLATMSRPTEAIMIFMPIFWNTHTPMAARIKWQLVKQHRAHIAAAALGGLLGILPQLIYWKNTTGSFIFDVGSKWDFLNPHFRVLMGWEKGWFIYTPITIFFIAGMFFMRNFPFRKSVLWFCLLNIYIIIGWHEWRYGGSYSTRALVQSYPLFALPFAAVADRLLTSKWKIPFYVLCSYLLFVNLFQIIQYNSTVLHYDDMNRQYYGSIYLDPHPTPADMSLLDNDELIKDEKGFNKTVLYATDTPKLVSWSEGGNITLFESGGPAPRITEQWIKVEATINAQGLWQSFLNADITIADSVKHARVRLFSPISKEGQANDYVLYMRVPALKGQTSTRVYLSPAGNFTGTLSSLRISELGKK